MPEELHGAIMSRIKRLDGIERNVGVVRSWKLGQMLRVAQLDRHDVLQDAADGMRARNITGLIQQVRVLVQQCAPPC